MFAEDEQLLPLGIFTDLLKHAGSDTDKAARRIDKLFTAMQKKGGDYGDHDIAWFNGGLFKSIDVPPLTAADLAALHRAAADMDWRAIDPTIFGTLFERGLDPDAMSAADLADTVRRPSRRIRREVVDLFRQRRRWTLDGLVDLWVPSERDRERLDEFVEDLGRTSMGKISRRALRARQTSAMRATSWSISGSRITSAAPAMPASSAIQPA